MGRVRSSYKWIQVHIETRWGENVAGGLWALLARVRNRTGSSSNQVDVQNTTHPVQRPVVFDTEYTVEHGFIFIDCLTDTAGRQVLVIRDMD